METSNLKFYFFSLIIMVATCASAQSVAINTDGSSPDTSSMLDVSSTSQGILLPRMTSTERESVSSPATGLLIYDLTESILYYYTGSVWQRMDAVVVGSNSGDLPTSPYTGQLYLDTSGASDKLYIYTSTGQWAEISLSVVANIYVD